MENIYQLKQPTFFGLLSQDVRNKILYHEHVSKFEGGQIIHSRGDLKQGLSIVKTGGASAGVYGADGKFVMVSVLGPGESFGEFTIYTQLPRTHDMAAVGQTEIIQIPMVRYQRLERQHPEITRALLGATLWRTHMLLETVDAMRRLPVLERTAKLLLSMLRADEASNSINCRQSELAFTLGISRVSIGKALKRLETLGFIKLGYGHIELLDPLQFQRWVDQRSETVSVAPL